MKPHVPNQVVGWGAEATVPPRAWTASRLFCQRLAALGIGDAFGVLGGGIAPFADGLRGTPIRFFHFRHEAGAGFAAIEASFATDRPTLVVVTTGPGLFNVLNAAMAARVDGAKLVVVSGSTSRAQLGRGAVQETGPFTTPAAFTRADTLFHYAATPETLDELAAVTQQLERGLRSAGGFVAHVALPLSLQNLAVAAPADPPRPWAITRPAPDQQTVDECLARLSRGRAAIWIGHGARGAARELRAFAEAAALPVLSSPRAKGIFPESHPLFVGVTGAGGTSGVRRAFAHRRFDVILVVGSRLGEVTSFLLTDHTPALGWIHVDVDPTAFGAAFPGVPGLGVIADARAMLAALRARALETGWFTHRPPLSPSLHTIEERPLAPRAEKEVRPAFLMQAIQTRIVDGSDAVVMSEAGNSFAWCNHALRFDEPGRYRTSAAWGSMGHFAAGSVGAAIAGDRPVVAVVGDGAMLMNNEINTAVAYGARVVWIVLNDAQLGLNEHGMRAIGISPIETQLPRTDFVAFARSQGADGVAVELEADLDGALAQALAARRPFVVDVRMDRTIPSPVVADRIRSLAASMEVA